MSVFTTTNEEIDAATLEQEVNERLEAALEGWKAAQGDLLEWANKAFSRIGAVIFDQASTTEAGMFKRFGEAVASEPPIQAVPATGESTWTMVDNAGYTIPAGTQVSIPAAGDTTVGFITVEDVTVAAGSTTATVLLQAIEPGTEGNGLTEAPSLVDALAFVQSIALDAATSGGVDEEEEDAYLSRLVEVLQTLSSSLILPRDFEIDARGLAGVARCQCIRNYNPEDKTTENPLMQCVFPIDEAGEPLSSAVKTELLERQEAKLLTDVRHHVADPEYTEVDVTSTIVVQPGFDAATVIAAVEARLAEYFSPAKWGIPAQGDSGSGWENRTAVYRNELISEIDRIGGVERVVTLELAKHGNALEAMEELALAGVAPLTRPGTFTITEA